MQLLIMKEDRPPHFKGDIVEIRASGTPFGGREPEAFVLVEVPDLPMADFENHNRSWDLELGFEVVAQDQAQDGYRLRLYSANANNGLGEISRENVEAFINSWGGTVHSVATNEVIFDIRIYDALTSSAFWEIQTIADNVVFSEISYDQATGIHRIQADYTALQNNPTYVERYVSGMNLTIVSHADRILVYDAARSVVRAAFQNDMKEKSRRRVARRRYCVGSGVVDYVVNQGGVAQTDRATLESYIQDKMVI